MKTSTSTKEKNEIIEKFVEKLENMTKIQAEMFKNLRAFQVFYNQKIKWFEHEIVAHKQRFVVHLTQKLKKLKKNETEKKYKSITAVKPDWKELLSIKLANIE